MIELPHSGLSVPHTDLHVVSLREAMHAYGVSFTAVIAVGQRVVGVAENDGRGGPTSFQPGASNVFTWRDMEDFAAQCRHGGEPVDVGGVLDCLVDEYDLARRIATATRLGRTLIRAVVMDRYPTNVVEVDPPATDAQRAALIAHLADVPVPDGARWEIWDGHRWTTLTGQTP
ncbi:hypothetical protein E1264_02690 [Actinomadura sp. KC216]|uniref:hypothetical protein n=1 Tax=Actinomadura sp. KC216 TaxID=2530370 RepID=UPI0010457543|nr:hypothetical protein [Actinomadura sp. KC216]TDB91215.1 hypothetical protein E1264_02690 [Actinomadura sp. KC216]